MNLFITALLVSILCLAPFGLYLCRVLKDPFHPLIFVGSLAFFVACQRPLMNPEPAFRYVTPAALCVYLVVVGLSVAAFYVGFNFRRRPNARFAYTATAVQNVVFNSERLFAFGMLYVLMGVVVYAFTGYEYTVTGYVRDFIILWMSGFILILQAVLLNRRLIGPGLLFMAIAIYPPIDRFFSYGQRGDTFRLACIFIPAFLLLRKRPSFSLFVPIALGLALVLSVLEKTRGMVESGEASNRVQAVLHVIPVFFETKSVRYTGDEEFIFGTGMVDTVRHTHEYNFGRFLCDFGVRFLPKEFFDKDPLYSPWSRTHAYLTTGDHEGFNIYYGSMPTGFAHVFVELWWCAILFWAGLGYWIGRRYELAIGTDRLDYQAYFTAIFMFLLYLIAQDLMAIIELIYLAIPLWIAYRVARKRPDLETSTSYISNVDTLPTFSSGEPATILAN